MQSAHPNTREELTKKLALEADTRLPDVDAKIVKPFLSQYYRQTAIDEFESTSIGDLYGAALAHWQFGKKRQSEQILIRVYNPKYETHGWQSSHSIVEIVCNDMPFLVDSISIVLNQTEQTIYHCLHPVFRNKRNSENVLTKTTASDSAKDGVIQESFMQFHIDRITESKDVIQLENSLADTLNDVVLAVRDWKEMHQSVSELSNNEANIRYFSDNVSSLKNPTIEINNVTTPFNPATMLVLIVSHSRKGDINVIAAAIISAGHIKR